MSGSEGESPANDLLLNPLTGENVGAARKAISTGVQMDDIEDTVAHLTASQAEQLDMLDRLQQNVERIRKDLAFVGLAVGIVLVLTIVLVAQR